MDQEVLFEEYKKLFTRYQETHDESLIEDAKQLRSEADLMTATRIINWHLYEITKLITDFVATGDSEDYS